MIEDPRGLAEAAGIAGVEGIDGLMLGPADFAAEIGALGTPDDPRVTAAAAAVRTHARVAGIAPVSIVSSAVGARNAFGAGDSVVLYNVTHAVGELFTGLASARPGPAPTRPGSSTGPFTGLSSGLSGGLFTGTSSPGREPLVLLPGMLGDGTVWEAVAAELADVAAPQFGRIDLDDSITEMAASVLAVAPARFALAGHSLGAIVALEIARQAPERITRLALVNASGRGPSDAQQDVLGDYASPHRAGRIRAGGRGTGPSDPAGSTAQRHRVGRRQRAYGGPRRPGGPAPSASGPANAHVVLGRARRRSTYPC